MQGQGMWLQKYVLKALLARPMNMDSPDDPQMNCPDSRGGAARKLLAPNSYLKKVTFHASELPDCLYYAVRDRVTPRE
jgi:hypothetical protein